MSGARQGDLAHAALASSMRFIELDAAAWSNNTVRVMARNISPTATFDLGAMIRWLDYNDACNGMLTMHPSDGLAGVLMLGDHLSRRAVAAGSMTRFFGLMLWRQPASQASGAPDPFQGSPREPEPAHPQGVHFGPSP